MQRCKKCLALWYLAQKFQPEQTYTEAQINSLLDERCTFHDPATLRRELYNKRLIDRTIDGSGYWKKTQFPRGEDFLAQACCYPLPTLLVLV